MNTNDNIITVNDLPIQIVRKKIKNIHLAVYPPNGWVRIAVPEMIDNEAVRLAVISKFKWIKHKIQSFKDQTRQSAREFITGESHYYLGKRYLLDITYTEKSSFVNIHNKKMLVLNIHKNNELKERKKLLMDWYRDEMKNILPSIVKKWEIKTGLQVGEFRIKRMKTKWGSCNPSKKRIWLNLELIKKSINCIEYVVVHEMVHFIERKHNKNFIFHMDRLIPQWKTFRDDLNRFPLAHENW